MKKTVTLLLTFVLMISFAAIANAATGTVVYATKVDNAPNFEEDTPFIDESWGEPAIVFNSSSPNTYLWQFWQEGNPNKDNSDWLANMSVLSQIMPEDGDVEVYYLWDSKYLYLGVKTPDVAPSGSSLLWRGDGIHTWISPAEVLRGQEFIQSCWTDGTELETIYDANESIFDFYITLDSSDWDSHAGAAAAVIDTEVWVDEDGYMYAYARIPLVSLGLNLKTDLHGTQLVTALNRVSSLGVEDGGYAGWVSWGRYYYETQADSLNTIVLVDPAQGTPDVSVDTTPVETTAPETDAPETDAPETDAPETDAPETDAPETDAPETDAPETDAPETDAPETDAPETDAPETDAPETDAPETDAPEPDPGVGGLPIL